MEILFALGLDVEIIGVTTFCDFPKTGQNWKSIPVVKMNPIYVVDSNLMDRPTPRIVEGLEAMFRMIHPEAFEKKM